MSTEAAVFTNSPPVPSGDEFSPEEIAILKGETPPEAAPTAPVAQDMPSEPANDDIDAVDEIETENPDHPRDDKGRFVPKSAYLRVKGEKDNISQKLATVATELIRQREREAIFRDALSSARPEKQSEQEREITAEEDIFAFAKRQQQEIGELKKMLQGGDPWGLSQKLEAMQLQTAAAQDLTAFQTKEPAFADAFAYLSKHRAAELEALGVGDPGRRDQMIKDEAREIIKTALTSNRSAAETIWKLAQARGFQAKPKDAPVIDPKAAEQIERINKGKEASATLRGTGTTADTGAPLTLAKLADMSEAEYFRTRDSYVQKNGRAAWDRLTNGG
jgi:hypothetical protein